MLPSYLKYISLLIFSGLIITFYRISLRPLRGDAPAKFITGKQAVQREPFLLLKDVILPLFPALDPTDFSPTK